MSADRLTRLSSFEFRRVQDDHGISSHTPRSNIRFMHLGRVTFICQCDGKGRSGTENPVSIMICSLISDVLMRFTIPFSVLNMTCSQRFSNAVATLSKHCRNVMAQPSPYIVGCCQAVIPSCFNDFVLAVDQVSKFSISRLSSVS